MTDLGIKIALDGARKHNLNETLNEMMAFEQACGCRQPEQTFYRYPVPEGQMQFLNQYRLIVKQPDGRMCLTRLGREIVGQL